MFHIKDDIRAQRSAQLLYNGLMTLLDTKPFTQITVSDLSRESTVGRTTFYRHFDDTIDILTWQCNTHMHDALTNYVADFKPNDETSSLLRYVLTSILSPQNVKAWEMLLEMERLDIIYNVFIQNAHIVLECYEQMGLYHPNDDYAYFVSTRVGFLTGILNGWLHSGKQQTVDEILAIVLRQHQEVIASELLF
ncbi:hypothetical protein AYR62_13445 [Secundilactobacillus paracollinoides]|uniref:TetR/AcrR family transcriptional regulator n=1 Tax=Secundilactobacillus paracollinoides TaxID=240427 RepID=UPI0006D2528C|nr:hypothetical protein [Secundilactobacillus paracollinoides]ANZ64981.1 hypothetical protein AYR62_13445 [Secundilactobacillus paracollinoides]KRL78856.1 hypothetical protein FC17_GL000873 [Secundilactobacillus paracollinoides DSM 15502 = JCM 11969]